MYKHNIIFIAFDTHKSFCEIAHIEDYYGAKPIHHGRIKTTKSAIQSYDAIACLWARSLVAIGDQMLSTPVLQFYCHKITVFFDGL